MDDEFPPRVAADRAWTVFLAAHADVDVADHRRCTLKRYLHGKWQAGESDPEELTCLGLSYLSRLGPDEGGGMRQIADIIRRVIARSARPDLVLVAISSMAAAVFALALKVTFGSSS